MPVKVGKVEFYAGPHLVGGPDNLEDAIVGFIDAARKSLDVAVQELESRPIADALLRARLRRVKIKIVLEQDYLRASRIQPRPYEASGSNEDNRIIQNALLRANIDLKIDYNASIFHQKFIIRDGTSLLTGSTNFTPTGTDKNLNHVIILHDPSVAKLYSNEFNEIQQGHFGKLNEGHDPTPADVTVSSVPVRVLFAPDHNPEMEIMKQMLKARKRIDFAIFTFAKSSGIDDAMMTMLDLGLPIRGAYDGHQGAQKWAAIGPLKQKGADLFAVKSGSGVGKLHHKLMVLDGQVVIGGSFNYTGPANRVNDENIIILGDLETKSSAKRKAQRRIAEYALAEIDRIIRDHGQN